MNHIQTVLNESFRELAAQAAKDKVRLEMLTSGGESLSLKYADGKLDKFQSGTSRMAGLRVIDGAAQGYASTENLSLESLRRTYAQALENARLLKNSAETQEVPLAGPEPVADAMEDLFRPQNVPMEQKHEFARKLEGRPKERDERVKKVPYSNFSESTGWQSIQNTAGLSRFWQSSAYSGFAYLLAEDRGSSKMDGESFFSRDFASIDLEHVVGEAVRRATGRLGASKLATGKLPVLIDREVSATLLDMLEGSLSAKALFEKTSLLGDRRGERLFSEKLTLLDDPFDREGLGARPWDSEGSASRKTTLIENGVLKNFMTNLEFAKRLGLPHTAHAMRSPGGEMDIGGSTLIVAKGTKTREQLLGWAPRMLWLTEFSGGLHAGYREQSGDFSMPAEGFLVENGKVVGPVEQFVVSGNILQLLRDIVEVSSEVHPVPSSKRVPDILVRELSVAGAS